MFSREFKVKKIDLAKKMSTIFQHKIRVFLKCYTVRDLYINEDTQTFKFKKSHKINTIKMEDPKEYVGHYEIKQYGEDDEYVILKFMI